MNGQRESFTSGRLFLKQVLRKLFLEDWVLKLTAILITLALWYGVSLSNKKGTATMNAQLAFRVSSDTVLTEAGVQNVMIRIAGDDEKIDELLGTDVRVTADLTQLEPGDRVQQLTPQNVSIALPQGVRLEDIQPSRIAVKLEAVLQKDIPVRAATVGEPASGYEVYSTTVNPTRIRVSGPESVISALDTVPTSPVDVDGAKSDLTARQVPVRLEGPNVTVFDTVVDVTVEIGEKRVQRTFELSSSGKKITAVLFGPRSLISKLRPTDLKVEVGKDLTGSESPKLNLPESMQGVVEITALKFNN